MWRLEVKSTLISAPGMISHVQELQLKKLLPSLQEYVCWIHAISQECFYLVNITRAVIYLFICGLFNDAASSSDYLASNDRTTNEQCIGMYTDGSDLGVI
jgi:hypothetical protein